MGTHHAADQITAADAGAVFEVNAVGIVRVTHTVLPLLRKSANPVIVNVSSGMGSFAATHDTENAADPGHTATDFNGHSGPQTVTEGTDAIVELATVGADGPTGTFRDRHGAMAW